MIETYREMKPLPNCFCRCYPAGTIFSGWEESVLQQKTKVSNMLDATARQHTARCIDQRRHHDAINVIAYDRSNEAPRCKRCNGGSCHPSDVSNEYCGTCIGTGRDLFAVNLWRWKIKPLLRCYFLLHKWEMVIENGHHDGGDYKVEVCTCGAERIVRWNIPYSLRPWIEHATIFNRTAAWDTPGTHSRGSG